MEKTKLSDTYYHLELVPVHFQKEHKIELFLKGNNLALFLSDVGGAYKVKVQQINHDGFIV